jgi:hypothetical protein
VVETPIAPQLEVLRGVPALGLGVVERVGEADAFDRFLNGVSIAWAQAARK